MRLAILENPDEVGTTAACYLVGLLDRSVSLTVGLPTGRTPLPFYAALRGVLAGTKGASARLRLFLLDEYLGLAPDDPRRFSIAN